MRLVASVFSVSIIAIMSALSARAEIVSTELLNKRLNTTGNLATVAHTGKYSDLTGRPTIPTVNNATLTIQQNGTAVKTFTANSGTDVTANITVPTKTSQLTNDSNFATTGQVNAKVSTAQGAANAGKGLVVNATSGNLELQDIATQAELNSGLSGKQNSLSAAQLNAANSGITSGKVSTYDGYAAQIAGKLAGVAEATGEGNVVTAVSKDASNNVTVTKGLTAATPTDVTNAINALDVAASTAAGNVVTNVSQTNGKIAVTRGTITSANNPTITINQGSNSQTFTLNQAGNKTIELTDNNTTYTTGTATYSGTTKLYAATGTNTDGTLTQKAITDELAKKQNALGYTAENHANMATETYTSGDKTKYPSIKVAETIAGKAVEGFSLGLGTLAGMNSVGTDQINAKAVTSAKLSDEVQASLSKANTALQAHQDISGKQDKATAVTHTANTAVGDSTHPVYVASNGVATRIEKVASATNADTATNARKICSGSTCTSFVDIWVE